MPPLFLKDKEPEGGKNCFLPLINFRGPLRLREPKAHEIVTAEGHHGKVSRMPLEFNDVKKSM